MNKRGQMNVGIVLTVAIGLIVALVLYATVTQIVGQAVTTATASNQTVTMSAAGSPYSLNGQAVVGTIIVTNGSNGTLIPSTNYTVASNQVINGVLTATITPKAVAPVAGASGINLSYTYQPDGYIASSGGRAMALLIPIMAALAIIVFALSPTFRSGVMKMLGG